MNSSSSFKRGLLLLLLFGCLHYQIEREREREREREYKKGRKEKVETLK